MNEFKNDNPFKIPEGYFEKLEEQLCNTEDTVSKLNPFSTPIDYFEKLEGAILETTASEKVFKFNTRKIFITLTSTAAAVLLVLGIFQQSPSQEPDQEQALNEFIENYYLEDFDSYEMLSMMEDNEIELSLDQITNP